MFRLLMLICLVLCFVAERVDARRSEGREKEREGGRGVYITCSRC